MKCVCGKDIWGEGWEPSTGQKFFSHIEDGEEMHADGTWVRPPDYANWFAKPHCSHCRQGKHLECHRTYCGCYHKFHATIAPSTEAKP